MSYQYKVVVIQHKFVFDVQESDIFKCSILSVGIDHSWRPLKWNIDHSIYPSTSSVAYVNGVLYWCAENRHVNRLIPKVKCHDTTKLIAFDVAKEEFDMIVVPIKSEEENVSIQDIGGRLCLMTVTQCRN